MRTLQRLAELADDAGLDTEDLSCMRNSNQEPVSEQILETAEKLRADLIIMGLHHSAHAGVISHLDLATTYEVVCDANSPVLTVTARSGYALRPQATEVTASPLSEADVIRSHGFGVKW